MDERTRAVEGRVAGIGRRLPTTVAILGAVIGIGIPLLGTAADSVPASRSSHDRPDVNGRWMALVTYDWADATYEETFVFEGTGTEVLGTASFLQVPRGILEGSVEGGDIRFETRTDELVGSERRETVHRYRGTVQEDGIHFVMQTEGSASPHVPITFVATRAPGDTASTRE